MADIAFVPGGSAVAYSNGDQTVSAFSGWSIIPVSVAVPATGQWYCEFDLDGSSVMFGVARSSTPVTGEFPGQGPTSGVSQGDGARVSTGFAWQDASSFGSSAGPIGISVDADTKLIRWYAGGVLQAPVATYVLGADLYFCVGPYPGRGSITVKQAAAATIPSGFTYISEAAETYVVAGSVRVNGVVLTSPRRVRVHRRSDGVLLGEADTVDGLFSISVGVSAAEVYLVPLDLDSGATDWAPPCANRVVPVLAA